VPGDWARGMAGTPQCESFMHLHLGIDAAGLPDDLEIHHIVVDDWDLGACPPGSGLGLGFGRRLTVPHEVEEELQVDVLMLAPDWQERLLTHHLYDTRRETLARK